MRFDRRLPPLLVAALACSAPGAALAASVTVSDIVTTAPGGLSIEIPSIEAVDANLDEAGIRALFEGADLDSLTESLSTLDAASVTIPEVTVRYDIPTYQGSGGERGEIVYYDLVMQGVVDGVAADASLGTIEMAGPDDTAVVIGTISVNRLDLGGILGFYGFGPEPRGTQMKPLYENFQLLGATVRSPQFTCEIGPADAERFSARPIQGSFDELATLSSELEKSERTGEPPPPETLSQFVTFYADFLTAFESTPTAIAGISCRGEDGKRMVRTTVENMSVGGFLPGVYPAIGIENFRLEADDGWFAFDSFEWKAMDLNGPIAALLAAKDQLTEAWFEQNWRKVIPAIEGFSLSGLSFDVPEPSRPGNRSRLSIGAMDLTLSDYVDGIPATVAASGEGILVELPDDAEGRMLSHLGFERLDLGYDLAARWNEAEQEIVVDRLTLTGERMGALSFSGTIGNVTPELFAANVATAEAAAAALTLKNLTIEVRNDGLAPALIALAAWEEDKDPEVFHLALTGLARALPLAILGATPEALGLGDALGSFLSGAPNLKLTLTSVDPAGIGMADLMAAEENPAVLKDKVRISAETSGEPVAFVWPEPIPPEPDEDIVPFGNPEPADGSKPVRPPPPAAGPDPSGEDAGGSR